WLSISVAGQRALQATLFARTSSARPCAMSVIPSLLMAYATFEAAPAGSIGGDIMRMWPYFCAIIVGSTWWLQAKAARALTAITRSNFFIGVAATGCQ